jgi:hypothetical protein
MFPKKKKIRKKKKRGVTLQVPTAQQDLPFAQQTPRETILISAGDIVIANVKALAAGRVGRINPPQDKPTPLVRADQMVPDTPYRYAKTPDCFYVRPKTVTADVLRKRLDRKGASLHGRDMSLLMDLARLEAPVVAWRVSRYLVDGRRTERKEYVVLDPAAQFRRLKRTPGYC